MTATTRTGTRSWRRSTSSSSRCPTRQLFQRRPTGRDAAAAKAQVAAERATTTHAGGDRSCDSRSRSRSASACCSGRTSIAAVSGSPATSPRRRGRRGVASGARLDVAASHGARARAVPAARRVGARPRRDRGAAAHRLRETRPANRPAGRAGASVTAARTRGTQPRLAPRAGCSAIAARVCRRSGTFPDDQDLQELHRRRVVRAVDRRVLREPQSRRHERPDRPVPAVDTPTTSIARSRRRSADSSSGGARRRPRAATCCVASATSSSKRKEEIADLMTREMGKPLAETRGDVQEGIDTAYYAATEGRRLVRSHRAERAARTSGR